MIVVENYKRKGIIKNPCFVFKQSVIHIDYLFYIYFIFLHWGYVLPFTTPVVINTKDYQGHIDNYIIFRTVTSPNLLYIYKMFYRYKDGKYV